MIETKNKTDEERRLVALQSYDILDSLPDEEFDNLAQLAAEITGTPVSQINLIDKYRQWSKSSIGLNAESRERQREHSVCQYTIMGIGMTEIKDLREDTRTSEFEYVKMDNGLRYYLGIPLMSEGKYAIGTLCVLDYKEKELSDNQIKQLKIIAKQVMTHLELHKKNLELQKLNEYKVQLMKMLSHDMRSPLNGIIGLSSMLREQLKEEGSDHIEVIDIIEQSSSQLNQMIDEVMNYSLIESQGLTLSPGNVNLQETVDNISRLYRPATRTKSIDLKIYTEDLEEPVWLDGDKFEQVIGNLLSNAIKYTRSGGCVKLSLIRKQDILELRVTDSGIGMSDEETEKLLQDKEIRYQQFSKGTNGEKSTGIGFSIVKHIIDLFDGEIQIDSTPGEGTTIHIEIPVSVAT